MGRLSNEKPIFLVFHLTVSDPTTGVAGDGPSVRLGFAMAQQLFNHAEAVLPDLKAVGAVGGFDQDGSCEGSPHPGEPLRQAI